MLFWNVNMFLAFAISVIFTGILIPKILLISFRKKLFDGQDERKIHRGVVPRLGGIAFKPVIFFSMLFLLGIDMIIGNGKIFHELQYDVPEIAFGWCSIIVLYLVGIADDLIGVRYRAKFIVQILCGIMLVFSGLWINNLHGVLGIYEIPKYIGYPLTIFVIVFIVNAINLIDGIDGLASGLSGVALLFYGIVFMHLHQYIYALMAFATLGTLVPFFYYNVFGKAEHGRKIFMGDTGSLTIGIILSFLCIKICSYSPEKVALMPNAILMAFVPLFVPCFDVIRVVIHRFRNKKHLFEPDMNHIHHKLLRMGISQRWAMISILLFSLLFTLSNVLLSSVLNINVLLICDVIVWTVLNIWLTSRIETKNKKTIQ